MKKNKRILIKLSGEAFEDVENSISPKILEDIFYQIKYIKEKYNLEILIVVGGGNIFRGNLSSKIGLGNDTAPADYMGMLATTINAIAINAYFNKNNLSSVTFNSFSINNFLEEVSIKKANDEIKNGKIIIFGGGTGKPYVSTDTAAALRSIEMNVELILIAKNGVDGVYDSDPKENKNAKFLSKLKYIDLIEKNLKVIDLKASKMLNSSKNNINVIIFNMKKKNNIINVFEKDDLLKTIITK